MSATSQGVLAALGLSAVLGCACSTERTGSRPNVLLIVVDTLRQDRLHCYGYPRRISPHIDRLAREGAVFDGRAPSSWTKPSVASILTGLHPLRHQVIGPQDALPQGAETLAERLATIGYSSLGISANLWISEDSGFEQGFDKFHDMGTLGHGHVATGDLVNEEVLARLSDLPEPFFLYVHYVDPHVPYQPPLQWNGEPLSEDLAMRAPLDNADLQPLSFVRRDPQLVRDASDLYDGEIRHVDQRIGALLDAVAGSGRVRPTLTILTSDHGEEFEDHGRMGHGHTLYSEQVRVPLVFHAPGLIPGSTNQLGPASLMDVVPTLVDLLEAGGGLAALDGASLEPRWLPGVAPGARRTFLYHLDHPDGHALGIEDGSRKLLVSKYPYLKAVYRVADGREVEPARTGDLASADGLRLADEMVATYHDLVASRLEREMSPIDPDTSEALLALGYLDAADWGRRLLPERIGLPDTEPWGTLGWEGTIESCIVVADPRTEHQLLKGWHLSRRDRGKWTRPFASAVVRIGEDHTVLRIEGTNHNANPFTVAVSVANRLALEGSPGPGPFVLAAPLPDGTAAGPALVTMNVTPPFVPASQGYEDDRILGVFLNRICAER